MLDQVTLNNDFGLQRARLNTSLLGFFVSFNKLLQGWV